MTTDFHLGSILSVTTGKMVSPTGMRGLYEILSYLIGNEVFTHEIPRALAFCRPYLLEQHPQLKVVQLADGEIKSEKEAKTWLKAHIELFGETLPLKPIGGYQLMHPVEELLWLRGTDETDNLLVINVCDEETEEE